MAADGWTVAEFFAGFGMVRLAVEEAGGQVVWANDIEPVKARVYAANFGDKDLLVGDVCDVSGDDIPTVDVATASFPCTDLSVAGSRRGLAGTRSGMFWEFVRVLEEMGDRRPSVVLLENVPGFVTSHNGDDLDAAIRALNGFGYPVDVVQVDARWFVPQSRPRLFIIGSPKLTGVPVTVPSALRPAPLTDFITTHPELDVRATVTTAPEAVRVAFSGPVERFPADDSVWWDDARVGAFLASLSLVQVRRLNVLVEGFQTVWRTAYRRTRGGVPRWEIREDTVAGCLRTTGGGSSRQAVVEVGDEAVKVRWMTAR